jgi:hypothetical protein
MIGFEISLNGQPLCTAGAGDLGVVTAIVSSVAKRKELALEIGGLADDAHLEWPAPRSLAVGDEVRIRIVETDHPDPPVTTKRDDVKLVEEGERRYYERLKRKYESK